MAIKFIAKKYYTFSELAQHWQCELSEIRHAVINGDLVPSIHVSGRKYETFQFSPDDEGDGFKYPSPLFDWDNRTMGIYKGL